MDNQKIPSTEGHSDKTSEQGFGDLDRCLDSLCNNPYPFSEHQEKWKKFWTLKDIWMWGTAICSVIHFFWDKDLGRHFYTSEKRHAKEHIVASWQRTHPLLWIWSWWMRKDWPLVQASPVQMPLFVLVIATCRTGSQRPVRTTGTSWSWHALRSCSQVFVAFLHAQRDCRILLCALGQIWPGCVLRQFWPGPCQRVAWIINV